MKGRLLKIVERYKNKHILVVGDLMLDHFMSGSIERISPEASVPVVLIQQESFRPGGAGLTTSIIAALGGKVTLLGVVGDDSCAQQLFYEFKKRHIDISNIIVEKNFKTTQKIRVLSRNQHIARVDRDNEKPIDRKTEEQIIQLAHKHIQSIDCLVVSDYAKGLVNKSMAHALVSLAHEYKKPVIVDTKPQHLSYFRYATLLTPNYKEAKEFTALEGLEKMGNEIQKRLHCNVLITKDLAGMILFQDREITYFPAKAKHVSNIAGAGDAVVATIALSLAGKSTLKDAAEIANNLATMIIEKPPMARITLHALRGRLLAEK